VDPSFTARTHELAQTEIILSASRQSASPRNSTLFSSAISDYWSLTKPRINLVIAIATFTGFYLANARQTGPFPFSLALRTIFGTLLVASGAATLNQFLEFQFDAQMRRTAHRPLAAGRVRPSVGLVLGMAMVTIGSLYLAITVNLLASALAIVTLLTYLWIYTPLKRKAPICTLVGALPGAMPPLIGWAGASGSLRSGAWILTGILFLWQLPHFMAIAWMYREDYERAGYRVLPRSSRRGAFVTWMIVAPLSILIPLSIMSTLLGDAGTYYGCGALLAGSAFLLRVRFCGP
jgi:protoheme IX farnesyltransferase